jgi:hypothetical protein
MAIEVFLIELQAKQDISGPRQKFKIPPDCLICMVLEFTLAHIL